MLVHFQLQCPEVKGADVYVNGWFTNDRLLPECKMTYDPTSQRYEAVIPLKFGYYNYQYLMKSIDGQISRVPY